MGGEIRFIERPYKIEKRKLLFTEGKDDAATFKKFLSDLGITDVQVKGVNGISEFMNKLPEIFKIPNFKNVYNLGIIRDAEKNDSNPQTSAKNAYESIFNIIIKNDKIKAVLGKKVKFKYMNKWKNNKISVGIFITCKLGFGYGTLEDMLLKPLEGTPEMRCVDRFLRCVRGDSNDPNYLDYFKNSSKNKILAFLATQKKAHGSIHVAVEKGIWNIFSPEFSELRDFLEGFGG
ncbi:MAG: DUF3226 domain-containing protein [Candidatus Thorarchaeota archaeon]